MDEQEILAQRVTKDFFAWQCRIRQDAMRQAGGRPSDGMYARLLGGSGGDSPQQPEGYNDTKIVFLLQRQDAQQYTAQFRFIVTANLDPQERRQRGLKILAGSYYQNSPMFLPLVTATFARNSKLAELLLRAGKGVVSKGVNKARFVCSENTHSFVWQARVEESFAGSDLYEASLAHNRLFATQPPQRVLVFHAEQITQAD